MATRLGRFALLAMLLAAGLAVLGPAGRPAGLSGEVAAVGRIGSFGQRGRGRA